MYRFFSKICLNACCLLGIIVLIFSSVGPTVQIHAVITPTGGVVSGATPNNALYVNVSEATGFKECKFGSQDPASSSTAFQKCLTQIFNFFFVAGIFAVALRIVIEALGSLNPFEKGKAVDNSVKLIGDVVVGLMLLGAPGLFLQFFNPNSLNIDVIKSLLPLSQSNTNNTSGAASGMTAEQINNAITAPAGDPNKAKIDGYITSANGAFTNDNTQINPAEVAALKAIYDQGNSAVKAYIDSKLVYTQPSQTANIRYLPSIYDEKFVLLNTPAPGSTTVIMDKRSDDFNSIVNPARLTLIATPSSSNPNGCSAIKAITTSIIAGYVNASPDCTLRYTNN